jgi:DNA-binding transcriptional ArsR family regulator
MRQKSRNATPFIPLSLGAAADLYRALGNPILLGCLVQLVGGDASPGELAETMPAAGASSVSQALAKARALGLVSRRNAGGRRIYSIAPAWRQVLAEVAARVET